MFLQINDHWFNFNFLQQNWALWVIYTHACVPQYQCQLLITQPLQNANLLPSAVESWWQTARNLSPIQQKRTMKRVKNSKPRKQVFQKDILWPLWFSWESVCSTPYALILVWPLEQCAITILLNRMDLQFTRFVQLFQQPGSQGLERGCYSWIRT